MDGKPELLGGGALGSIVRAAWRHKTVAVVITCLVFAALAFLITNLTPRYTTSALLRITSSSKADLDPSRASNTITDPFVIKSEVEAIGSDALSLRVIDRLDLQQVPEFTSEGVIPHIRSLAKLLLEEIRWIPGLDKITDILNKQEMRKDGLSPDEIRRQRVLAKYKSRLSVFNDGRSLTVRLGFTSEDPRLAQTIVNTHVQAYLEQQTERRTKVQESTIAWLDNELTARANELRETEAAVQSFRIDNGLILTFYQPAQQQSLVDQELFQLNEKLTAARAELIQTTSRLERVKSATERGVLRGTSDMFNSTVLSRLLESEATAQVNINRASQLYGNDSRNMVAPRAELTSIQNAIRQEVDRIRGGLVADLSAATISVRMLEAEVARAKEHKQQLDRAEAKVRELEAVAAAKRSIYDAVLRRLNLLRAELSYSGPDSELVSEALIPITPSFPKTLLFLAVSLWVAAVAGVVAGFGFDRLRPSSRTIDEIARITGLRPLGLVPVPTRKSRKRRVEFLRLVLSERLRAIRQMLAQFDSNQSTVILVTSALPKEGKSIISAALAKSISVSGVSTILVDADLRCSSAAAQMGILENQLGLADLLKQTAEQADVIIPIGKNLSLLPAVPGSFDSVDELAADRMRDLLKSLRRQYRTIVIDSPPVGVVSDALALGAMADLSILVVGASSRDTNLLVKCIDRLRECGTNVVGFVMASPRIKDIVAEQRKFGGYFVRKKHETIEVANYPRPHPGPNLRTAQPLQRMPNTRRYSGSRTN